MNKSTLFGLPQWQVTLAIVFLSQLMNAVGFSLVFPFLPLYVQSLGSTAGFSIELMAGLVISAQGFTMMLASPLWGAFSDRYGRKLMVMRATFGGSVILALMGVVISGEQLIFLRALQGCVTGTVAANAALVAGSTPREKIGFAMGTLQVGLWGGVALGPLLGGLLADAFGYQMPFFITGTLLFLSGVLIYFGVEEEFQLPAVEKTPEVNIWRSMLAQWSHVIHSEGVTLIYLLRFLSSAGRQMIIPVAPLFVAALLPPDATAQNLSAGMVMAVSSATSTLSGVYLGNLGDRIGHRIVLVWAAAAAGLFYIPQAAVASVWQLLALQALAGLAIGGLISAPAALLARYTQPGEEGAVYGLDNSLVAGARAIAPLMGSSIAVFAGLRGTFTATAIILLIVAGAAYAFLPKDPIVHSQAQSARTASAASGD